MNKRTIPHWRIHVPAIIAACAAGHAHAQAPAEAQAAPPAKKTVAIEEVIVTAQRRAEASSKVPVTISAFNGATLARRTVTKETDLQSLVPGLTVKTGASSNQIDYAIRGQTLDAFSGSPPGVLPYMNDVAMASHTESSVSFYDLASVQVLKGPQGTLFGRNDTGGAVLFNTVQPDLERYSGFYTQRFGSYDLYEEQFGLNVPVIPDMLAVRVAGDALNNNGYVKNILAGGRLGDVSAQSGRVSVKFTPAEWLTNTTVFQYSTSSGTENNPLAYSAYYPGQIASDGTPLNTDAYVFSGGRIIPYIQLQKQRGYTEAELPFDPTHLGHGAMLQNTTIYSINSDIEIKNIFGITNSVSDSQNLFSGSPFQILSAYNPFTGAGNYDDQESKSEELQLLGHTADNELKYILGFYASWSSDRVTNPLDFGPVPFFEYDYRTTDTSKAAFTQVTYDLSQLSGIHGLSVTGGIRYTWETLGNTEEADGSFPNASPQQVKESDPSWQLGLQYQVTPAQLIYFVTRGSWRSGGFTNANPTDNLNEFSKENTHDYELGTKFTGKIYDTPVRLDFSMYDQITDNVQRDFYVNINGLVTGITANVPQAETRGLEANAEVRPLSWLRLGANVAYTYAYFSQPVATVFGQSLRFAQYADTPRWTGSVFVSADLPVPETWGSMTARADTYTQTSEYFESLDLPGTQIPGYTLVNLRYDWTNIFGSHASLGMYVKNLLDRKYLLGGFALGDTTGENLAIAGEPRNLGLEVSYKF